MIKTFCIEKIGNEMLIYLMHEIFDLCPYGLIKMLNLLHPIYLQISGYGYFGRFNAYEKK